MKKLWILLLIALSFVGSFAAAQNIERAQQLIDNLANTIDVAAVSSLEQEMTVDAEGMSMSLYQVLDFEGERIYQQMTMPEMGQIVMRYSNGEASMSMPGMPMSMPVPAPLTEQLTGAFRDSFQQTGAVPENYEIVSYDGSQSYAGLVTGEQVTLRVTDPTSGAQEFKLLFGADGRIAGALSSADAMGQMLTVFEEYPADGLVGTTTVAMYQLNGDSAELFGRSTINTISVNQSVDDSLFE